VWRFGPAALAPATAASLASLGAGAAAGRPDPDKQVRGGLLRVLMAGVGSSATIANVLLVIQHAVQFLL
jgi:uncharacterized membrane protein YccC